MLSPGKKRRRPGLAAKFQKNQNDRLTPAKTEEKMIKMAITGEFLSVFFDLAIAKTGYLKYIAIL